MKEGRRIERLVANKVVLSRESRGKWRLIVVAISLDTTRNATRYQSIVQLGLELGSARYSNRTMRFFLSSFSPSTNLRCQGLKEKEINLLRDLPIDQSIEWRSTMDDGCSPLSRISYRISRGAIKLAVLATYAPSNRRKLLYRGSRVAPRLSDRFFLKP